MKSSMFNLGFYGVIKTSAEKKMIRIFTITSKRFSIISAALENAGMQ